MWHPRLSFKLNNIDGVDSSFVIRDIIMCDFLNSSVIIIQEWDLYGIGVASATFLKKIKLCQRVIYYSRNNISIPIHDEMTILYDEQY